MAPDGDVTRLALLEQRIGRVEEDHKALTDMVTNMQRLLTGILVSVATSAILLAANVILGALK